MRIAAHDRNLNIIIIATVIYIESNSETQSNIILIG